MNTKPKRRKRFPDLELGAQLNEVRSQLVEVQAARASAVAYSSQLEKKITSLQNEIDYMRGRGDSMRSALLVSLQAGEALSRAWREQILAKRDTRIAVDGVRREP